jgi:HAD superfamily hydrolase (TIGR01509 family)
MALDALIIDADGFLLDVRPAQARAWRQAARQLGVDLEEDRIFPELGRTDDAVAKALLGRAAEGGNGEILRQAYARSREHRREDEGPQLRRGARELLDAIRARGLAIAVVSSGACGDRDLRELADVVVPGATPDDLQTALERLGLSPAQCALLCDTPYRAQAGRAAGLTAIALATEVHPSEALRQAGIRASYPSLEALGADLEAALRQSSPGPGALTRQHLVALMEDALEQAKEGMRQGEVPVGSVVARSDGTILARAFSRTRRTGDVTAHAEILALGDLTRRIAALPEDLVLVTTLEPCVMCYGAAMQARVDTVVYSLGAGGNGGLSCCSPMQGPRMVAPRMVGDILREESRRLLAKWLEEHGDSRFLGSLL